MPSAIDSGGIPERGSALQIAYYVECATEPLNSAVRDALGVEGPIDWVSPRAKERFAEYWDRKFIERVGHPELAKALSDWWPSGGAHWDALARVGARGVLLIEAKANIPEIENGSPSAAGNTGSKAGLGNREKIGSSLAETMKAYGVDPARADVWLNSHCYQYANRLAHLRFLHHHQVPAWLAHIYFTGDETYLATTREQFDAQRAKDATHMGVDGVDIPGAGVVFLKAEPEAKARLERLPAMARRAGQRSLR